MTAGLHHKWRRRAADMAALSPGGRALDVATGTGDLALELAQRVSPGGEVVATDFSERMLELARAKASARSHGGAARVVIRARQTRSSFRSATASSTRRRSASGRGTSQTSSRVCARWRASSGPAAASSCSRSPPRSGRRCRLFFELWFDRIVPALGSPGGRRAGVQLPAELGQALPRAPRARRDDVALRPGADSLRAHGGRHHRAPRGAWSDDDRVAFRRWSTSAGAAVGRLMDRVERRMAELATGHGPVLARYAGETIAAGGKRLRPLLVCVARRRPAARDRRPGAGRGVGRARPRRHAGPRRRPRRLAAAPRTPHRRCRRRSASGDGHRATCCSRGRSQSLPRAGRWRRCASCPERASELAEGELMQRADAWNAEVAVDRYLARCRLKTAVLFRAALRARRAGGQRRTADAWRHSASRSASPFRSSTTCSTSPGRPSARASRAAPTCSTAP